MSTFLFDATGCGKEEIPNPPPNSRRANDKTHRIRKIEFMERYSGFWPLDSLITALLGFGVWDLGFYSPPCLMISYSPLMKTALTLLLFLMFFTAGCAVYPPRPAAPPQPVYQHASLNQLLKRLSISSSTVVNIKADFSASMTDLKTRATQSCNGILAMEKPNKLRMRGSKAMLPTLFDLLDDGKRLTLYVPREKTIYHSERGAEAARRGIAGMASVTDIFFGDGDGSRGSCFLESSASQYTVYSISVREGTARLLRKIYFDRENLLPVRYQYFDGDGALACDVTCGDFFTPATGGRAIPGKIAFESPPGENRIVLTLSNIRTNNRLNPNLFTFATPADVRVRPIEEYAR